MTDGKDVSDHKVLKDPRGLKGKEGMMDLQVQMAKMDVKVLPGHRDLKGQKEQQDQKVLHVVVKQFLSLLIFIVLLNRQLDLPANRTAQ
jgi:hypothetical protein